MELAINIRPDIYLYFCIAKLCPLLRLDLQKYAATQKSDHFLSPCNQTALEINWKQTETTSLRHTWTACFSYAIWD